MPLTYESIASQTLTTTASSVTFSSIPASYTDLLLVCNVGSTSASQAIIMRANNDTASNYSYRTIRGNGTAVANEQQSNQTQIRISVAVDTSTAPGNHNTITHIMNYASTAMFKTILSRANNADINGTEMSASLWRSTSAINQLDIGLTGSTFVAGSTFALYGILAA